jgi:hypothetical protein
MHRAMWITRSKGVWITAQSQKILVSHKKTGEEKKGKEAVGRFRGYLHISNHHLMPCGYIEFILKTSTHLTITNASPKPSDGPTSHHHPEPVG